MTSSGHRYVGLCAGALALGAIAVYLNSFSVPFLFDDGPAIVHNETLTRLWPLERVLSPPPNGTTVSGRPFLNLTFGLNYAVGQLNPWTYHLVNLTIHCLAALCLFGIVRRTLLTPALKPRFGAASTPLALAVTGLWILHPLQTESVTYLVQRAESLAGLFYLLTLYCFLRGTESRPRFWYAFSIAACLLGMATKEVMVSAPVVVVLYDRTFGAGSLLAALRLRWRYYIGLAATWVLLGWLMSRTGHRGGTVGFDGPLLWSSYALTQCHAVVHYLWLCVFPRTLVFDYGTELIGSVFEAVPYIVILSLFLIASAFSLAKRTAVSFLAIWFFVILVPSSSVVPVASQTMAEHRLYLPLGAVLTGIVIGLYTMVGRRAFPVFAAAAVAFAFLTIKRNEVYQSEISLWRDVVTHRPANARAHFNLALALERQNDRKGALSEYQSTLQIDPRNAEVHLAYANLLSETGHVEDAKAENATAAQLDPGSFAAHFSAANAFVQQKRWVEAIAEYQETLRLRPAYLLAETNLGNAYLLNGQFENATKHYEEALRLEPTSYKTHYDFAVALHHEGHVEEASEQYRQSLELKPDYVDAHENLGTLLLQGGHFDAAVPHFEFVVQTEPASAAAYAKLGDALRQAGRLPEALVSYKETLRLNPNQADPHTNIGTILAQNGRVSEALPEFEKALRLDPNDANCRANFANALAYFNRFSEARSQCEEALRIDPKNMSAKELLDQLSVGSVAANPTKLREK